MEFRSFDDGGIVAPIFGRITPTGAVDANDKSVNEVEFDLVTDFRVEICGRSIHSKNYNQLEKLPGWTFLLRDRGAYPFTLYEERDD